MEQEVLVKLVREVERRVAALESSTARSKNNPPYNHTRGDGPFDPCEVCLPLMDKPALIALVRDLRETIEERESDREPTNQLQAMRACIVYARDNRGPRFDFDTWMRMVDAALNAGDVPPHELEEAQGQIRTLTAALDKMRAERDDASKREREAIVRARELEKALDGNTALMAAVGTDHCPRIAVDSYQIIGCKCGFETTSEDVLINHMAAQKVLETMSPAPPDHDDLTSVDHSDALERIHCPKAGQILHHGCGWCSVHNRPSFECLCNGTRAAVRPSDPMYRVPRCEQSAARSWAAHPCEAYAVHGEHWHDKMRWWCHNHVPMSGHHEHCPDPCRELVAAVTPKNVFTDLARSYEHLRRR